MDTTAAGRAAAKRALSVLLAVAAGWLAALGPGTAIALADTPPILSESFESGPGLPAGWKFMEYTPGHSTATIVSGAAAEGTHFLRIVSRELNHARVMVPVRLAPNTSYQFHAMAKASGANPNLAAVLGVDGQYTVTNSVRTDTQWQPLDLYLKAGSQESTVNLTMGLGHFGQLNVGTADFDAVTVTAVSAVPDGATVANIMPATPPPAKADTAAESASTQGPNEAIWVFVGILVVVAIGVAVSLLRRGEAEPALEGPAPEGPAPEGPALEGPAPEGDTPPRADIESGQADGGEPHAPAPHRTGPGNRS
ncbi:MAG TPA: hypothetical protein VFO16_03015 [Pseudonocardiaceae bacterium]|nr:hypothetical protein [Pseudonocardiaceae bacterium]